MIITTYLPIFYFKAEDVEPKLYEGDIVLSSNAHESSADALREKRNARRLRQHIWKTKIIPYEISSQLGKCQCVEAPKLVWNFPRLYGPIWY